MTDPASKLADDLARGIRLGRWPIGSMLPTEMELCEHYGASRYAVRQVMQRLTDQGLISRRRNLGTRVEASEPRSNFRQTIATVEDLAQFGATHVRVVQQVERIKADHALAAQLRCEPGRKWLRVSSVRMDAEHKSRPVGWTDAYIDDRLRSVEAAIRQSPDVLISSLIESAHGRRITRVRQDVAAVPLPKAVAGALKATAGEAALRIVRTYFDQDDEAFEVTISLHPADRYDLSMNLVRSA